MKVETSHCLTINSISCFTRQLCYFRLNPLSLFILCVKYFYNLYDQWSISWLIPSCYDSSFLVIPTQPLNFILEVSPFYSWELNSWGQTYIGFPKDQLILPYGTKRLKVLKFKNFAQLFETPMFFLQILKARPMDCQNL